MWMSIQCHAQDRFLTNYWQWEGPGLLTDYLQHLAATGPNVDILRDFLSDGASVHIRDHEGHTPLFLAAKVGLQEHVSLLRGAGAHLHPDEIAEAEAELESKRNPECWTMATTADT
jgi:lysophospholipase